MTIATTQNIVTARGNGATTVFNYGFLIPAQSDLVLTYTDANGVQTVIPPAQYSVTGIGGAAGGTVTYPLAGPAIATGTSLSIQRVLPVVQATSLVNQGAYYPSVVEGALDYLTMLIQQAIANINQGIYYPAVDQSPINVLPPAAARAGKFFAFDGNGNPIMLPGNNLAGDLLPYTVGGAAWTNPLYVTQNLINFNAGWYVTFTSSLANPIYGFASNVYRSAGSGVNSTVGGQFSGYAMTGVTSTTFGAAGQAWGQPGNASDLIGAEFDCINEADGHTNAKVGTNLVFYDRAGGVATVTNGLGSNKYNLASKALFISSQTRSTAGEYCGWRRGIDFDPDALDRDLNGTAIGIDFARVRYYGGTDPTTAYRMTAAIRLRDYQSILWNGDPTLPNDPTDPASPIRSYFAQSSPPNGRWVLTNTGIERFGVDMTTGDIYVNGVIFSGGSVSLSGNNTWTGNNTFTKTVTLGAGLAFTGTAARITGDFTNATVGNRTLLQTSYTNANTYVGIVPNGTSVEAGIDLISAAAANNCAVLHIAVNSSLASIQSVVAGAASYVPLTFNVNGEAMRIDTSARVLIGTTSSPVVTGVVLRVAGLIQVDNAGAFYAHRNGTDQTGIVSSTLTQVQFLTIPFNQDSAFNLGTSRWTPKAGKYFISAGIGVAAPTSGARYTVSIFKNGAAFKSVNAHASASVSLNASVACTIDASGSDYFEVWTFQNSGFTASLSGLESDTWFSGHRVG